MRKLYFIAMILLANPCLAESPRTIPELLATLPHPCDELLADLIKREKLRDSELPLFAMHYFERPGTRFLSSPEGAKIPRVRNVRIQTWTRFQIVNSDDKGFGFDFDQVRSGTNLKFDDGTQATVIRKDPLTQEALLHFNSEVRLESPLAVKRSPLFLADHGVRYELVMQDAQGRPHLIKVEVPKYWDPALTNQILTKLGRTVEMLPINKISLLKYIKIDVGRSPSGRAYSDKSGFYLVFPENFDTRSDQTMTMITFHEFGHLLGKSLSNSSEIWTPEGWRQIMLKSDDVVSKYVVTDGLRSKKPHDAEDFAEFFTFYMATDAGHFESPLRTQYGPRFDYLDIVFGHPLSH
jgi:hypothetical protein